MLLVLGWDNLGNAGPGWGSHIMLRWHEFEPTKGKHNFGLVEKALAAADRPCYLQIGFCMYDKVRKAPVDYTPNAHKRTIGLTAASGVTGYVPDYSATWTEAYKAALSALAGKFRDDPRVAGYWHAAGWGQETLAAVDNAGGQWATMLKGKLAADTFLGSLRASTLHALAVWGPKPVYLPGAASPGSVWGSRRREVVAELLQAGAGYMNCALLTDNDTAWGVGANEGKGLLDIALCRGARIGFEEGPRVAAKDPGEVYWMLLRALNAGADFVNLYSTISAPQAAQVAPRLPKQEWRWIVFRDREYPVKEYKGSDGQMYGHAGEPGNWGSGLILLPERTELVFTKTRFDEGRWRLRAPAGAELLTIGLADGDYPACLHYPDGGTQTVTVRLVEGKFALPAGEYHRVDLDPASGKPIVTREPLPEDEPVATAEKVRFWLEQEARDREAGKTGRADTILYSNIKLAYRLEGVTK